MYAKVPLQGAELEDHLRQEREAKEKEAAAQAVLARNRLMLEADEDESDESDDSDDEDEVTRTLNADGDEEMGEVSAKRRKGDGGGGDDWAMDGDDGLTKQFLSFDIYLKGNVSKANSFFKTVGAQTHRFRMFPHVEKKRRVDEYGETVDVGMWLRKGKVLEDEAETDEMRNYKRKLAEDDAKVR